MSNLPILYFTLIALMVVDQWRSSSNFSTSKHFLFFSGHALIVRSGKVLAGSGSWRSYMSSINSISRPTVPYLKLIRSVGFLLLFIFIGRVALVSVYGFAGVPKPGTSRIHSESSEQENDDKKEENKYAEKQFKCFAPALIGRPVIGAILVNGPDRPVLQIGSLTSTYLKVLTPPPNA